MALSLSEIVTIERLRQQWANQQAPDGLKLAYYQGRQRVEQLGMAVPPGMRQFLVVVNWPRVIVDTTVDRQQVRAFILPGEEQPSDDLREVADASNLTAHLRMFNLDRCVYGRAFFSVGANGEHPDLPLIRVESPTEMVAEIDTRYERIAVAARFYGSDEVTHYGPTDCTLYFADRTVWAKWVNGKWVEERRQPHSLGRVPIVLHLNRRTSSSWTGESQMSDIIPLTDSAARSLTNMQFAQEAHGVGRMVASGVSRGDFMKDGKLIPKWEAYFDAIHFLSSKDAKITQLTAADLKNFETAMMVYGKQASAITGFPSSYFGITSANPAAEGALRAEESRLVRSVEAQNVEVGMTLGWTMALAWRFRTGEWVKGNRIGVTWHDPATPTYSQRAEAIFKMTTGDNPILSREGAWDELGWTEARKSQERRYFEEQSLMDFSALRLIPDAPVGD